MTKKFTKLVLIHCFSYFCTSLYVGNDLNFFNVTQKSVREQICSEFEKITGRVQFPALHLRDNPLKPQIMQSTQKIQAWL